jgi:pimeloyl-ACP methyl ester carboxylesterase
MKFVLKLFVWLLSGVLILILATAGSGLGYRAWKQSSIEATTAIESTQGIESLEQLELNGSIQWIYLRGHDIANPVLLFLHGGPGTVELPVARHFGLEVEKHFTVVHWDQRGAGKSRSEDFAESDLTIRTHMDDALALVNQLRARFDQDKIYLVGHSWGSVLGTLIVRDNPDLFHAYVGMGQLVNMVENETVSLRYVRERAEAEGNTEALAELQGLSPPYSENPAELGIQRKWLFTYEGSIKGISPLSLLALYLTSPEYSLQDVIAVATGTDSIARYMWPELGQIDFFTQAPELEVPVYFFTGRHDYNTPFEITERYFDLLIAPHKEMIWFENSAHVMNASEPEYYQKMLIEKVLQGPVSSRESK